MSESSPFGPPDANRPRSVGPAPAGPVGHPAPPPTSSVASPAGSPGAHIVTDQRPANGAVVAIAWIVAVLSFGYMLPWAVAATRGRSNQGAIALINFLLGWSIAGWIVAMVMACQAHQVVGMGGSTTVVVAQQFTHASPVGAAPAGWYPVPGGGRRYWNGAAWTDHHAP